MNLENGHETKKKIFLAASKLFSQTCYADVGIREIAKEAGIKVPTVYHYYPSKEAILDDLLQFYIDRLTRFHRTSTELDYDQDPIECFKKMVFAFENDEFVLIRQLMRIALNEQCRSPLAAKAIFDISMRNGKKCYYEFLSHLKDKGVLQCGSLDSFAEILSRLGTTFAMQFVRDDEIDKTPDYVTVVMDLFMLMLKAK